MSAVSLDVMDASEADRDARLHLELGRCDRVVLDRSLCRFVGVDGYDVESLRGDLERFMFLLGGDGEAMFGPNSR